MKTSKATKILHLTDIHGADFLIDEIADILKKVDLVIISGDITHFGKEQETQNVIDKILFYNQKIIAITGNCDFEGVHDFLSKKKINLHREFYNFKELTFFGISGSLPCPGKTPNEFTEEQVKSWLNEMNHKVNKSSNIILVIHQPPINTLNDMVGEDQHVGSTEIRRYIEQNQPILCLTGHIHEGIGVDSIGKCKIVNPGPFRTGKYAIITINKDYSTKIELNQIRA